MHDLSLGKLYKEISKRLVSERTVATASLTVNRRYCYSGEDVERREGGHVLANYEQKGDTASNSFNTRWNCQPTDHQARKCSTPLTAKVRDMIEDAVKRWPSTGRRAGKSQVQASTRITQNIKIVDENVRLSMMMLMSAKKKYNSL